MRSEDMKRNATLAIPGLTAAMLAVAMLAAVAFAQDTSTTSPAPAGEVGQKPGEGAGSKPAEGSGSKPADGKAAKPKTASPAPAGEVGSKPGEGGGAKPADDAAPSGTSKSTPQHFEPTEKVRPDFDVAFPIDI
jgi:hypothetical protein